MEVFRKNLEKSLTLVFLSIKGKIISVRKMNINNRLLKILDFLESNSITSIKEVTKALNISDRVVRYEIDNLNFILKLNKLPIVKKESKGKLLFDESLKTDETLGIIKNISKHSREERLDFIKLKFLIEGSVNLTSLSKILDTSRTTIRADILEITKEFEKDHIIIKDNKIQLNEKNIRNFIIKYFHKDLIKFYYNKSSSTDKNLIYTYFYDLICDINIIYINKFIKEVLKKLENKNNNFHEYIFSYIILLCIRIKQNKNIKNAENEIFLKNTSEYTIISKYLDNLENKIKINFSSKERLTLIDYILGFMSYSYNTSIFEDWIKIEIFIKNMILKVNKHMQINIADDDELLDSLLSHIKPTIYRLKNNLNIERDIYFEAVEAYPELFSLIMESLGELEILVNKKIPDSEIALFTLHFLASLERNKNNDSINEKKKVVLICGGGYGTSMLVAKQITQSYNLEIISIISYMQFLDYNFKNIDLVITTLKLKNEFSNMLEIPIIRITPFFNNSDQKKLGTFLSKKKFSEEKLSQILEIIEKNSIIQDKNKLISELNQSLFEQVICDIKPKDKDLSDFISEKKCQILEKEVNWKTALEICGKSLIKSKDINKKYIDEITNIIENFGIHFILENGVAIPHGEVAKNVYSSSIGILYSKKPIKFPNNKKVSLIFLIAAKTTKDHVKSIEDIVKLSQNKKFLKEISIINKPFEFLETIEKYLK